MVVSKKAALPPGEGELKFAFPNPKALSSKLSLDDAHGIVVRQNAGLLKAEGSMRQVTYCIAYNNFDLFLRAYAFDEPKALIDNWLKKRDINLKTVKSKNLSKRFARSVWPDDDGGRRSSDEAKVLDAAKRYFDVKMPHKTPTKKQYIEWIEDCGGLNNIRRGSMSVELGGKTSGAPNRPTASEIFVARRNQAREFSCIGKIPFTPKGARENELVLFYGIVEGHNTSLRLACRLPSEDEGSKNVHALAASQILHDGELLIPNEIGDNVTTVMDTNARTASEVLDQAAEQAS